MGRRAHAERAADAAWDRRERRCWRLRWWSPRCRSALPGLLLDPAWIRVDALLLPLDYGTSVGADLAAQGALYADDVEQLLRYRDAGAFAGYRDPDGYCGTAIRQPRPSGLVVCQNLGNGAADLVVADYVLRSALAAGSGTVLNL